MNREDCSKWMRRQVEQKARRFVLSTVPSEFRKGSEELLAVKVPPRVQDKWYKATARAVEDASARDMETLDHPSQAYALIAYDKEDELMDRFPFREIDPDGDTAPVDATNTGLMAQLMTHNRDMARAMTDMHKTASSYYERTIDTLATSHAKMMEEKLSTIEMIERLKSEEFDRRLTLKREEASDEMRGTLINKLLALAPVVVSKITGKNVPGAPGENDHLLLSLVETLSPDQLESLMHVLTPEQSVIVLTLIEKFKRKEEPETEAQQLPKGPPDVKLVK